MLKSAMASLAFAQHALCVHGETWVVIYMASLSQLNELNACLPRAYHKLSDTNNRAHSNLSRISPQYVACCASSFSCSATPCVRIHLKLVCCSVNEKACMCRASLPCQRSPLHQQFPMLAKSATPASSYKKLLVVAIKSFHTNDDQSALRVGGFVTKAIPT